MVCRKCSVALDTASNWTEALARKNDKICLPCKQEYQRAYHKANRDARLKQQRKRYSENKVEVLAKQKENYIKKTFGLSVNEYNNYLANPCSICGTNEDLVLDHCHDSGKVRGCLCRTCNMALGLFKDKIELLTKAKEYLSDHKTSD